MINQARGSTWRAGVSHAVTWNRQRARLQASSPIRTMGPDRAFLPSKPDSIRLTRSLGAEQIHLG